MRKLVWMVAVGAILASGLAFSADGDEVVGLWATAPDEVDGNAHVEIYERDGKYYGKIVWLEKPVYPPDDEGGMAGQEKVDRENPDPALRSRKINGLDIVFDFVYAGKNKWKKGKIYAPDDGKTYKAKLTLGEDGVLNVRGFVGISMLGRTEEWTRVKSED